MLGSRGQLVPLTSSSSGILNAQCPAAAGRGRERRESSGGQRARLSSCSTFTPTSGGGSPRDLGAVLGLLLYTVGFIGVAFGNGTMCTTYYETGHYCDALNNWLEAGLIGQGLLLAASVGVLLAAPVLAARRRAMTITAWCIVALAIAWYVAYATGAYLSWRSGLT